MDIVEALEAIASAPVARLATIRPDGDPHLVPITFAVIGGAIVTMIDSKPKTTTSLQRLRNIEAHPAVSLLVDHYHRDWDRLWWIRADGEASIHTSGEPWRSAQTALAAKYPQYASDPPAGPAIVVSVSRVTSWRSTP